MKLKLLPVFTTMIVTAALLFGGWYLYEHTAVERPLVKAIGSLPGVESVKPVVGTDTVTVNLTLGSDADLRSLYEEIAEKGKNAIGGRKLNLDITSESSAKLDQIWSGELFTIAEAMESRRYSEIPAAMEKLERTHKGLVVTSDMDDKNVYITMKLDSAVKYIVLPRIGDKIGVWPGA
ncbi:hypothetical protein VN24_24515 [Paenibacillus beijingensis]|uniref:Uncharacterized protein n=1 Tax=Paenibacillus beijingensis TaxID=1126833 RepID=A0A0D5NSW6_9BACL|nr:hypothetical protein VN24_24515 [Paenibacillus beijingensis]